MPTPFPDYYDDLPSGSIRLLRLLPNENKKAPIKCKLFAYPLQEWGKRTHPYDALSYVWGSWDNPESISISEQNSTNRHDFLVTRNLHEALSHLRHRSIDRILWIDAVSINQKNNKEKEQQIQFMAKTYAQADRVVVWLGGTADDSDEALKEIRIAGGKKSTYSFNEAIQEAVVALLQRPWFQRIWVLQEVAAARHALITCGPSEIDGYAFCLGIDSFLSIDRGLPELQSLARSVTYLIRGSIFRPKYSMDESRRSTLDICSLDELMDMYHARKATVCHDKVYALLGMSSDDLNKDILPDYEVSWKDLFQRLVKHLLHKDISVETWEKTEVGDKTEVRDKTNIGDSTLIEEKAQIAVVRSKGCVLGKVSSVQSSIASDDRQDVDVTFMNIWGQPKNTEVRSERWNLHASAKFIQSGDIICLLQGTLKPSIIRLCEDHFDIIMIAVSPPEKIPMGDGYIEWLKLLQSRTIFTRDFMLVWDWRNSHPEEYEALIQSSKVAHSGCMDRDIEDQLDNATRIWNVSLILGDLDEHQKAEEKLREAIEGYKIAFEERRHTPTSQYGLTPLSWASGNGYEAMVKLLLGKYGVGPDLKDSKYGRTPLSWAAENGHEVIVKLLLETDKADANSKDKTSRTPLSWASENGHDTIVELLLGKYGVDLDLKDSKNGRTPLSWATEKGHEAVVKLLFEMGEPDANSKDEQNRTPLSWASENGHNAIVKLLLGKYGVDPDLKDKDSRTPLSWAAEKGHEAVVKLLLETSRADVNSKRTGRGMWDIGDVGGDQTPLQWAAKGGHDAVVKLLLETGKADVNLQTFPKGSTSLLIAAKNGHEGVVKLLLKMGKAKVNLEDTDGQTSLSAAAANGHDTVVKLLLEKTKAKSNSKDRVGKTPLSHAARGGHETVVKLLLKTGKANVDLKDEGGITPLSYAATNGHEAVVKLLLQTGAEVNSVNQLGQASLAWAVAVANENEAIVKLLLEAKAKVNQIDKNGGTPLFYAAAHGHEAVVKLLLDAKAEVNLKSKDGETPLSCAAEGGHEAVVKLLLESKAEANSKDKDGESPLSWATKNGHEAVVKLLQSAPSLPTTDFSSSLVEFSSDNPFSSLSS